LLSVLHLALLLALLSVLHLALLSVLHLALLLALLSVLLLDPPPPLFGGVTLIPLLFFETKKLRPAPRTSGRAGKN
jgi:hypothetical protein